VRNSISHGDRTNGIVPPQARQVKALLLHRTTARASSSTKWFLPSLFASARHGTTDLHWVPRKRLPCRSLYPVEPKNSRNSFLHWKK
jgi:hypothetical protein